jgi:DDE superfamily endonuclease
MTSDLFVVWLEFFIATVRPSVDRKVLLVLDGQTTHAKSIAAIELAKENGVILLQLPTHFAERLQPLADSFLRPLKEAYAHQLRTWKRINPGLKVTSRQFAGIFSGAYEYLTNCGEATEGFSDNGIWPIDKDAFLGTEFGRTSLGKKSPSEPNISLEQIMSMSETPENLAAEVTSMQSVTRLY